MSNAKVSDDDQCVEGELGACRSCGCPRTASPEGEEETPHPKSAESRKPYSAYVDKLDPDLRERLFSGSSTTKQETRENSPKNTKDASDDESNEQIFDFPTTKLAPGERAEFQLTFPRPFHLNRLVAADDSMEGVFIKNIYIGGRSLVFSGCPMPASMFKLNSWPMSYEDPVVPAGAPLVVVARNDTKIEKLFKMGVLGTLSP